MARQQRTIDDPDTATVAAPPRSAALEEVLPAALLCWWPAWCLGFGIAVLNAGQERFLPPAFASFRGTEGEWAGYPVLRQASFAAALGSMLGATGTIRPSSGNASSWIEKPGPFLCAQAAPMRGVIGER